MNTYSDLWYKTAFLSSFFSDLAASTGSSISAYYGEEPEEKCKIYVKAAIGLLGLKIAQNPTKGIDASRATAAIALSASREKAWNTFISDRDDKDEIKEVVKQSPFLLEGDTRSVWFQIFGNHSEICRVTSEIGNKLLYSKEYTLDQDDEIFIKAAKYNKQVEERFRKGDYEEIPYDYIGEAEGCDDPLLLEWKLIRIRLEENNSISKCLKLIKNSQISNVFLKTAKDAMRWAIMGELHIMDRVTGEELDSAIYSAYREVLYIVADALAKDLIEEMETK